MTKLYGIAEFHPEILMIQAVTELNPLNYNFITEKVKNLMTGGLHGAAFDEIGDLIEGIQNKKNMDLSRQIDLVRMAAQIVYTENNLIRQHKPDVVYIEDFLDLSRSTNPEHALSPSIKDVGADTVFLGFPDGYEKRFMPLANIVDNDPNTNDDPLLKAKFKEVFEEKDHMWVPILERDIRNRGGTGMIVAGAYHLVEDSGFSGLTSKLLADKDLPVNIIYHNKYQG